MAADDSIRQEAAGRRIARRRRVLGRSRPGRPVMGDSRDSRMPYPLAAAAVGLLVAVLARVLIVGGEQACDAIRGTTSCGTAGGFMLLAIGALMIYAGMRLLRLLAVPEPGITSILGVALLTIVILAVLLDVIFSVWMWIVLPLVAAAVYAFAAWATARLSELGHS
jgi:peptidoglycan/LPS O-acetylase OafA/YrhL